MIGAAASSSSTNTLSSKRRSVPGSPRSKTNVGAAVARILTPFLVKQVVKYVADELCKSIGRLSAPAASPGLITIRGPERVLSLLRERVADLPAEIAYVEEDGVEAVVECERHPDHRPSFKPWAELLASLDA